VACLQRVPGKLQLRLDSDASAHLNLNGLKASAAGIDKGGQKIGNLLPIYTFKEREPYRAYFDLDKPRFL